MQSETKPAVRVYFAVDEQVGVDERAIKRLLDVVMKEEKQPTLTLSPESIPLHATSPCVKL